MSRWVRKPVPVQAHYFDGVNHEGLPDWARPYARLSGEVSCWLVRSPTGIEVIEPDLFLRTYDPAPGTV